MLGLEFVVRSQKMRATQIPCDQAQILTSCISDGSPSAVGQRLPWAPIRTWCSMIALRLRVAYCTRVLLDLLRCVFGLAFVCI